jgi:WD40 repeat protein
MNRPRPSDTLGSLVMHDLSWHADGSRIATDSGLWRDLILIWDLAAENNPQSLVVGYPDASGSDYMDVATLEWSRSGQWLLTSGSDGNVPSRSIIRLYDAITGEAVRTIFPGFHPIWGPNDEQIASISISEDGSVINIWDTETGEIQSNLEAYVRGIFFISWNFDANVIAGSDFEEYLILWDVDTGIKYDIEGIQMSNVRSIEWRPNSNQLAIADLDEGVMVLDFKFDR